jgi:hypothetical protein
VKCVGFDAAADIGPFVYAAGDGAIRGVLDTTTKASGGGALRFQIPPMTGANSSGGWLASLGSSFGQGKTFYVQFRQRFSPEMVNTNFGGHGWKQVIFHMNTQSCASIELTTQNLFHRGFPQMYTDCGSRGFEVDLGNGDYLLQQGEYNCHYQNQNQTDCSYYRSNQWMTFYYEVKIGNWGQANSSIKAWVGYEGGSLKQFINAPNYRLDFNNSSSDVYNSITLTPYNTTKPSTLNHPTAYIWYDELIVSTQPIPAPNTTATAQAPAAPTNLILQ